MVLSPYGFLLKSHLCLASSSSLSCFPGFLGENFHNKSLAFHSLSQNLLWRELYQKGSGKGGLEKDGWEEECPRFNSTK